jgi:hypothetical protein
MGDSQQRHVRVHRLYVRLRPSEGWIYSVTLRTISPRTDVCQFSAEQENERRVVNPDQENDQRRGGTICGLCGLSPPVLLGVRKAHEYTF